jgi:hypothetical protein
MSAALASLVTEALVLSLFSPFSSVIASTCMGLLPFSPEFVPGCTPSSLPLLLDTTVLHSALFPPLLDIISFNCLLGRVSTYIVGTIFTRCYGFEYPKKLLMVRIIQRKSGNAVESLYGATSECKSNQTQKTRMGTKSHQRNVGPHNTPLVLS